MAAAHLGLACGPIDRDCIGPSDGEMDLGGIIASGVVCCDAGGEGQEVRCRPEGGVPWVGVGRLHRTAGTCEAA